MLLNLVVVVVLVTVEYIVVVVVVYFYCTFTSNRQRRAGTIKIYILFGTFHMKQLLEFCFTSTRA